MTNLTEYKYKNIDYSSLIKARNTLNEIIENGKNTAEKMGAVQAFEICYELAWKTMKKILEVEGLEFNSPRSVFRESARVGIIKDPIKWFVYLEKRNITVHAYEASILDDLFFNTSRDFLVDLDKLILNIETKKRYA